MDRWLENLDGQPELLKKALDILSKHQEEAEAEGRATASWWTT